jgi:hypothetical protein
MATRNHTWRFFRAGGVDQVELGSGADLERLTELDQKLWVALACPTRGLHIDERTLDLVDTDHDGRIRPPEVLAAIAWASEAFTSLDVLLEGKDKDAVPLSAISDKTDVGRALRASAKRILANLGLPDASSISLEHVTSTTRIFSETTLNGDGVVPVEATDDPELKAAIEKIMAVAGSVADRSGKPGIDQSKIDAFFSRAAAWADWSDRGRSDTTIFTLGEVTPAAADAVHAIEAKLDDYFVRCNLAQLDDRLTTQLGVTEAATTELIDRDLATIDPRVERLPIARPRPGLELILGDGVYPAWRDRLAVLVTAAVGPILGARSALSENDWKTMKARVAPWQAWRASKPADAELEKLGDEAIVKLARGEARQKLTDLVARDAALAAEYDGVEAVEKMARYHRDLVSLLRNFVNFSEFYRTRSGAFQVGTLYVDGRSCDLCLPVRDVAKHASLAGLAKAYLAYCDCTRRKDAEKQTIVAAVTGGQVDNLMVGRNGVFYDRQGHDWDATVTRIVENPISVREAFWAPYKRFVRLIEEQVAKRASAANDDANKRLQDQAVATATADRTKDTPPAAPGPAGASAPAGAEKKIDVGTIAAIGVAVGGIATFFSSVLATFFGLGMWMPLGVVALVLAVSGPSMLIAWLKLRQRNIGPILDANGWAVNAFARINVPFGGALTSVAVLPRGASRSLRDPFAEKGSPWPAFVLVTAAIGLGVVWYLGKFDAYLPVKAQAASIRR